MALSISSTCLVDFFLILRSFSLIHEINCKRKPVELLNWFKHFEKEL